MRPIPRSVGINKSVISRSSTIDTFDDSKNMLDSDLNELDSSQIDERILRNLNGGILSKDSNGLNPETKIVASNTEPILRQPVRNESGMIVSVENDEKNYDLDIEMIDVRYTEKEFINAIDIEFHELNELKKNIPTLDPDINLVSKLRSDVNDRNNKITSLKRELNDTKINLKTLETTVNSVINNTGNSNTGISETELNRQVRIATLKERLINLEEDLSKSGLNLGLQISIQQKIIVIKDELKSLGVIV